MQSSENSIRYKLHKVTFILIINVVIVVIHVIYHFKAIFVLFMLELSMCTSDQYEVIYKGICSGIQNWPDYSIRGQRSNSLDLSVMTM